MKFLIVILVILLLAMAAAVSFDVVPYMMNIYLRMKMGSAGVGESWLEAAQSIVCKWLGKGVPIVPRVAGRRLSIIDRIKGTYKAVSIQSWQEGALLLAADEFGAAECETIIYKRIDKDSGCWIHPLTRVDEAYFAYAVLSSPYTDPEFIKPAMDEAAELLLEKYRSYGGIPYSADNDIRFVDSIGLACPFLMKYSLTYNNGTAMKAAIEMIEEYSRLGIHKELGLPVHCVNIKNGAPLGIYGWGRGCGWWASGLADCYEVLSATGQDEFLQEKVTVLKCMLHFAQTVVKYQLDDGSFDRNLLSRSGPDSSATAMIAYFLAYTGFLADKKEYINSAQKAMQYIYSRTRRDGTVDYSQGDTMGIGFYSQESIVLPAAQGFAVRAQMILDKGDEASV